MTTQRHLSPVSQAAHDLATTREDLDRIQANAEANAYADFEDTVRRAPGWVREGRPGWAEYKIARACVAVARAVGENASVEQMRTRVYFDAGHRIPLDGSVR